MQCLVSVQSNLFYKNENEIVDIYYMKGVNCHIGKNVAKISYHMLITCPL